MKKKIDQILILAHFDNCTSALIKSPERTVKIGLKTKIGWRIMLFGVWIVFGRRKKFQTILNPLYAIQEYAKDP